MATATTASPTSPGRATWLAHVSTRHSIPPLPSKCPAPRPWPALFDTARHILAKGFGLSKLEYKEIAREAAARGLIQSPQLAGRFTKIAGYRNRLVHHYENVTPEELFEILRNDLGDLEAIAGELRAAAKRLA